MTQPAWTSRIVRHGEEPPDQLLANPNNWRVHPFVQQQQIEGALDELGWLHEVVVNERTGHLVDGHARVAIAISRGESSVPVAYVDLSEDEERIALLTLDPLRMMAYRDQQRLDALAADARVQSDPRGPLAAMIADLQTPVSPEPTEPAPTTVPDLTAPPSDGSGPVPLTCPHCGTDFEVDRSLANG